MEIIILQLSKKFERLNIQSRILVTAAVFCSFYFLWGLVIEQTLTQLKVSLSAKKNSLRNALDEIDKNIDQTSDIVKSNPSLELTKRIQDNKKESILLDNAIREKTAKMVSPKDMNTVLGYIVQENEGLKLIKMDSSPVKKLEDKNKNPADDKNSGMNIFQHFVSMEIAGGYFDVLTFMKDIESRKLNIMWDEIDYEVQTYPIANVKIIIHTLNLDEGLLGV